MLKKYSIVIGILVGLIGVMNGFVDIWSKVYSGPRGIEQVNLSIIGQTPLISKSVEVFPDPNIDLRIGVSFKVYRTGDIIIESGNKRKLIPFNLEFASVSNFWPISTAFAGNVSKQTLDKKQYDVETIKYLETSKVVAGKKIKQKREYEDGTIEIKMIDLTTNKILSTKKTTVKLTQARRARIAKSGFEKKVYRAKR